MTPNASPATDDAPHNERRAPRDDRRLERSDTVLWTLAPPGIVLHNFARRCFLELDGTGYKAWGFLDGARSVDEVVSRSSAGQDGGKPLAEQEDYVRQIVETLVENGFVVDRPTGEPAR